MKLEVHDQGGGSWDTRAKKERGEITGVRKAGSENRKCHIVRAAAYFYLHLHPRVMTEQNRNYIKKEIW